MRATCSPAAKVRFPELFMEFRAHGRVDIASGGSRGVRPDPTEDFVTLECTQHACMWGRTGCRVVDIGHHGDVLCIVKLQIEDFPKSKPECSRKIVCLAAFSFRCE